MMDLPAMQLKALKEPTEFFQITSIFLSEVHIWLASCGIRDRTFGVKVSTNVVDHTPSTPNLVTVQKGPAKFNHE